MAFNPACKTSRQRQDVDKALSIWRGLERLKKLLDPVGHLSVVCGDAGVVSFVDEQLEIGVHPQLTHFLWQMAHINATRSLIFG